MKRYAQILSATTILAASSNVALADFDPFLEFILMGGVASVDAEDTSLVISSNETDKLVQTNSNDWNA